MIDAEWKARGGAQVFHRKRNCTASSEQDQGASRTIRKGGEDQRAGNENCRERLRERSWIPGKPDCGCKNAGDGQPKHGLLLRPRCNWPCRRRAAEKRDELAPSHWLLRGSGQATVSVQTSVAKRAVERPAVPALGQKRTHAPQQKRITIRSPRRRAPKNSPAARSPWPLRS